MQDEKQKAQQKKRILQEGKLKEREEKLKLKAEKKKASEKLKQLKPGECMKVYTYSFYSLLNNFEFGFHQWNIAIMYFEAYGFPSSLFLHSSIPAC